MIDERGLAIEASQETAEAQRRQTHACRGATSFINIKAKAEPRRPAAAAARVIRRSYQRIL